MAGLLPEFITNITKKIPLFGGASEGITENSTTTSSAGNNSSNKPTDTPKNLNELVDKVMDNTNIDNQTKRDILTVILNNLQHQPSATPSSASNTVPASNMASNTGTTLPAITGQPANMHMLMPIPQIPQYYPPQYSGYPYQPQIAPPINNMYYPGMAQPFMSAPQHMLMPQNMYYPGVIQGHTMLPFEQQPNGGQIVQLASKVNELSIEMADLIKIMKGELVPGTNNRKSNMAHIRAMIDKLSATDSSNQPEPVVSMNSSDVSSEAQSLGDLPSKSSGPDSIVDTVGSAINSINTALGLNSNSSETAGATATNTPATNKSANVEPKTENKVPELNEEEKKLLEDEATAKAANNANKPSTASPNADNMIDLDQYKPQEQLDNTIDEKSIEEGLENAAENTGTATAANKPANNTGMTATTANKPANNTGMTATTANKPANNTGPATAVNKPANNTGTATANKPANNLAAAIGNLSKTTQEQPEQKQPEQQQLVGGGLQSKTLKKKSASMLASMANVLGLTTTTQKKKQPQGAKRGRPRKNKE